MRYSRNLTLAVLVGLFLFLLALSWVCGRGERASRNLRFRPGDGSVSPLVVLLTRGRLETNQIAPAPAPPVVAYMHRFYYASPESVRPVSALRYRVAWLLQPVFRVFGAQDKIAGPCSTMSTLADTSLLWFGCRTTNTLSDKQAVLVSDQGLRVPLFYSAENVLTASSEHLVTWQLPLLLTNRGNYSLLLPDSNQTLVKFVLD